MSHEPVRPSDEAGQIETLRRLFLTFGATQCAGRSAVYERLSEEVARDEVMLDLMLSTPSDQRRPSLLFACVNLLLASNPGTELAAYYPIHGGSRRVDDRLAPAFFDFCGAHHRALARLLRERSTQTNEIRRCIALRLGLAHMRHRWPGPFALVEIGASAGLNLIFDHYNYALGRRDTESAAKGPVVIRCDVRGAPKAGLLGDTPSITRRLGVDQQPIDLSDPGARAWLEAFIWPELVEDLATLRGAMDLWRSHTVDATVVAGEATADTARLMAELPGEEPVAVFTASLLSYLGLAARADFVAQLDEASRRRPVAWIFAEAPGLLATSGIDAPALRGPLARRNIDYLVGVSHRGRSREDRLLALADPYVRWLAPARSDTDDFQWALDERPG